MIKAPESHLLGGLSIRRGASRNGSAVPTVPRQGGVQAKVARAGCNIGQLLSVKSRAMALGAVPVAQLRAASARTSAAVVVHAL